MPVTPCCYATASVVSPLVYDSFEPGCFCFHDALRNLCGAFLPCACTQQFLGASQPCAIKRGGGFPLQCVLGVAALLSPTRFLRVVGGALLFTLVRCRVQGSLIQEF